MATGKGTPARRLWQRQRLEDADRLTALRNRIRRSLDDCRPDLDGHEVDARLATLFAAAQPDDRGA